MADVSRRRVTGRLRRLSTFQARLSILVAAAVGVAVALATLAAYFAVSNQQYGEIRATLNSDLQSCFDQGGGMNLKGLVTVSNSGALLGVFSEEGQLLSLLDNQLQPYVFHDPPAPTRTQLAMAPHHQQQAITTETLSGKPYRVLAYAFAGETLGTGPTNAVTANVVLVIAVPLSETIATLHHLRFVLVLIILLGVAIAMFLGSLVAMSTIVPVKRLTAAAEHVAATQDLESTIEDDRDDELGRLAHAFNQMLGALRSSRQQQAQLVSDAGHELRTPLTSLRTNIEFLCKARELPEADREELLADVRGQIEELTSLVGDIVETARQDEQHAREYNEVRLDAVLNRAVERAERRAPSLTFDVQVTPGAVKGQPALLERALLNILDNAAKWSPPGGTVEVRLRRADRWTLEVRDHGPGIAAEDLDRVFDRFYRAPTARSMPGSGLGLAIVRQVVTDHGGTVQAFAAPGGGTLVRIQLPIVDEVEPADVTPLAGGRSPGADREGSGVGSKG